MNRATHCPNCFQEPAPAPRCAHCGFDAESYLQTNEILPLFAALAGDKYRVGRVLGQGGFGVVYAGWARRLKRRVAIKEFFPAVENPLAQRQGITVTARPRYQAAFADWKEQFLREAELLAQFSHPRIVQVHDIVEENNTVYLIMERLDGHTLNDHLGGLRERGETLHVERRLSPEDGRRLLHAALEALAELHGHRPPVLHRDLTPHNLFLVGGQIDRLKVLDFGLARLGERTQSVVSLVARVGNPGFAAPEQLGLYPGAITPATDFYTLGATLYTALAGVAPPNAERRCAAQPPQSLAPLPNLDPTLAQVIRACLEISPKQRPQSVADICKRLAAGTVAFPDPEPVPAPPPPLKLKPELPPAQPRPQPKPKPAPTPPLQLNPEPLHPQPRPEPKPAVAPDPLLPTPQWIWGLILVALGAGAFALWKLQQPPLVPSDSRQPYESEMVKIAAGCFQMGSPESETDRDSDERQHRVCVEAFEIGKYEVTQGQWKAVMGDNPSGFKSGDNYPVETVSWNDTQTYLKKLNQQTGKQYRLPTEAEWEYAARAGTTTPFWTGRCVHTDQANYDGNYDYGTPDCGAKTGVYRHKTLPVGSFKPNPWGLYDTMGNVWEWTCSAYEKDYNGAEQRCDNKDTGGALAVRGGSWFDLPAWVRSADRDRDDPPSLHLGFRLARSL